MSFKVQAGRLPRLKIVICQSADHGRVIHAEGHCRHAKRAVEFVGQFRGGGAEGGIGGHPSAENERLRPGDRGGAAQLDSQDVHDGCLKARGHVSDLLLGEVLDAVRTAGVWLPGPRHAVDVIQHRRLDAAEGEVQRLALQQRAGKVDGGWVPLLRGAVNHRPARVPQIQDAGHLVVGLTGSVVNRAAQQFQIHRRLAAIQGRVPAGADQRDGGVVDRRTVQGWSVRVRIDMVHANQRDPVHPGQRLGRHQPHQQRADQTRLVRHRDGGQVFGPQV